MYNEIQKKALGKLLQAKFMSGDSEGHEIVVALLAMVKDKRLKEQDVRPLLMTVYMNNREGVMRALQKAHKLVDDEMIDDILNEVKPPK